MAVGVQDGVGDGVGAVRVGQPHMWILTWKPQLSWILSMSHPRRWFGMGQPQGRFRTSRRRLQRNTQNGLRKCSKSILLSREGSLIENLDRFLYYVNTSRREPHLAFSLRAVKYVAVPHR